MKIRSDKRAAVMTLLQDEEWGKWSDREVARRTNTSAPFVAKCKGDVTVNVYSDDTGHRCKSCDAPIDKRWADFTGFCAKCNPRTYTTKHGTVATMNTANIGGNGSTKPITAKRVQEVVDRRTGEVFNAKIRGKHDESKRKIFYRRGYGSFRVLSMHEVGSMAELNTLIQTPKRTLPKAAK